MSVRAVILAVIFLVNHLISPLFSRTVEKILSTSFSSIIISPRARRNRSRVKQSLKKNLRKRQRIKKINAIIKHQLSLLVLITTQRKLNPSIRIKSMNPSIMEESVIMLLNQLKKIHSDVKILYKIASAESIDKSLIKAW